MHHLIFRTH